MESKSSVVANTNIDKHGESLSYATLKLLDEQSRKNIASSHNEHDFRNPPIARAVDSHIIGNSLYVTFDFFDIEDVNKLNPSAQTEGKRLAIHKYENERINIVYDRSISSDDDLLTKLNELQSIVDPQATLKFDLKKSIEPITVLTVVISYIGMKFVDSFFERVADKFWDALSDALSMGKMKKEDSVFTLMFHLPYDDKEQEVLINFTNSCAHEIKQALEKDKEKIYTLVEQYKSDNVDVSRIVFNYTDCELIHEYSVLVDGTPIDIRDLKKYKSLLKPYDMKAISDKKVTVVKRKKSSKKKRGKVSK
ncbi:MAG: hypothetical protein ACRC5D_03260 [Aeromonas allosaccharophila]